MSERFIPDRYDISFYEHMHRYQLIKDLVKDKNVLDIACGEGYGSSIISEYAKNVTAVDINEESIQAAKLKYSSQNIKFQTSDIYSLPFSENEFDIIISYETIEHVNEPEKAIIELSRVLKKEGLLVISTPNKSEYTDARMFNNPFHLHEFYQDEFKELMQKYFQNCSFYGQRMIRSSLVWDMKKEFETTNFIGNILNLEPMYFIVICSNSALPDLRESQFTNGFADSEITKAQNTIENYEIEIINARNAINEKNIEVINARNTINEKNSEVLNAQNSINQLQTEISNAKISIISLEKELKEKNIKQSNESDYLQQINNAKLVIDAKQLEIKKAGDSIEKLVHENQEAKKSIDYLNFKISEAEKNLQKLQEQIDLSINSEEYYKNEILKLQDEYDRNIKKIDELNGELKEIKGKFPFNIIKAFKKR